MSLSYGTGDFRLRRCDYKDVAPTVLERNRLPKGELRGARRGDWGAPLGLGFAAE